MRSRLLFCLLPFFVGHAQEPAQFATEGAGEKSVEAIAARSRASIVKVLQVGREGMEGLGAGFVVSSDGLVATNLHVIGEARRLEVETGDGEKHEVVEVAATDAHWDLALLRVKTQNLKPLPLANSAELRQGQPIVAMGNPEGLSFSVVEGVVSEYPDIVNDVPMIRVAVPIEKGNSGGPLLNRRGEVVGILTLKSARTQNLGFAMPVNELKHLIEKPNPVPMERWLTIGVLNPRFWKPILGAQWTQHAGVIKAASPGSGFGGRSLCLSTSGEPPAVFEVAAQVRLEDEAGAAGLAFCSDGAEAHYGFYPSAGKLRLTRFEGPDVFSWTILADVATPAYRAGEWNHLRVRVEADQIICFVNGQEVLRHEDSVLRGGKAGLCKFRNTVAEFKAFRVGADLAEQPVPHEVAAQVKGILDAYLTENTPREDALTGLLADAAAGRKVLVERRRALEREAAALRELEKDLHRRNMTREIVAELAKPEPSIDLIRCALLLARHDNPEVEVGHYMQVVAQMVAELRKDAEIRAGGLTAVKRLNRFLFQENGFHGSRHDYENRSNSYLNEVIDDREGLPITLSVLFVELAHRLGVTEVAGLPLPGKFMVGYREGPEGEWMLIDTFERGKVLTTEQAALELTDAPALEEQFLKPATKRTVILRMLRNLLNGSLDGPGADTAKDSLPYLNLVLALDPDAALERFTRARVNEQNGDRAAAIEDVEWLIENLHEGPEETRLKLEQWLRSLRP